MERPFSVSGAESVWRGLFSDVEFIIFDVGHLDKLVLRVETRINLLLADETALTVLVGSIAGDRWPV